MPSVPVFNEQTKLLAGALSTASTSCFTVGIATPLAGYLYNFSNLQGTLTLGVLASGFSGWLTAAVVLHLAGAASPSETAVVNEYFIFAFVVAPAVVICLGLAAERLHARAAARFDRELAKQRADNP